MKLDFDDNSELDFNDNSEMTQPLLWTLLFVVCIVLNWEVQALFK